MYFSISVKLFIVYLFVVTTQLSAVNSLSVTTQLSALNSLINQNLYHHFVFILIIINS